MERAIQKKDMVLVKNVLFFYYLLHPRQQANYIYRAWSRNKALADYQRPDLLMICNWLEEFRKELSYG